MQLDRNAPRRKSGISLTPLIDVVFILLLFFMLTSTFVPWRVLQTNLSVMADVTEEKKTLHALTLKSNDAVFWYKDKLFSLTDNQIIEELLVADVNSIFTLKANEGVTLQTLITTADFLKKKGAVFISIANAFNSTSIRSSSTNTVPKNAAFTPKIEHQTP